MKLYNIIFATRNCIVVCVGEVISTLRTSAVLRASAVHMFARFFYRRFAGSPRYTGYASKLRHQRCCLNQY